MTKNVSILSLLALLLVIVFYAQKTKRDYDNYVMSANAEKLNDNRKIYNFSAHIYCLQTDWDLWKNEKDPMTATSLGGIFAKKLNLGIPDYSSKSSKLTSSSLDAGWAIWSDKSNKKIDCNFQ